MIRVLLACVFLFSALPLYGAVEGESEIVSIRLVPDARTLSGKAASQQFVVMAKTAGGRELDLTEQARFTLADPELAAFRETGRLIALRDGETKVRAAVGAHEAEASLRIEGSSQQRPFSFSRDISAKLYPPRLQWQRLSWRREGSGGVQALPQRGPPAR